MTKWEYKSIKIKTGGFLGGKLDEVEFESEPISTEKTDGSLFHVLIQVWDKGHLGMSL